MIGWQTVMEVTLTKISMTSLNDVGLQAEGASFLISQGKWISANLRSVPPSALSAFGAPQMEQPQRKGWHLKDSQQVVFADANPRDDSAYVEIVNYGVMRELGHMNQLGQDALPFLTVASRYGRANLFGGDCTDRCSSTRCLLDRCFRSGFRR